MRKLLRSILLRPILWFTERFSSEPDQERIFACLTKLREEIEVKGGKKGFVIPFDTTAMPFVIFSDQHKGKRDGADDFAIAEPNYLQALDYYNKAGYHLISLGDSEELWENTMLQVIKVNEENFKLERQFLKRGAFTKVFGNHDLDWDIDPLAPVYLKQIYGSAVVAIEGVILRTTVDGKTLDIFCTHGHQGDKQSDGNWFSKFFVSKIWAPFQAYLRINPNTPAYDGHLKTRHNAIMYEWSALQQNLLLITGHTHQPVFESLTHLERLKREEKKALYKENKEWAEAIDLQIQWRRKTERDVRQDYLNLKPTYFNSGCCCYADGDITGLEIADGFVRLVKWKLVDGVSKRLVQEEKSLSALVQELNSTELSYR
jgi:predicted phosphodiesterase